MRLRVTNCERSSSASNASKRRSRNSWKEKEIYFEAKGNGFDVKILREVIRVRKQDPKQREEQELLLDLYLQAIKVAARAAKAA